MAFGLAIMLIISQEDLLSFFFFFLLSAFDVVIDIILAINDIIVWLEQADKVVEELVKLIPQEDTDKVLKKGVKDYQEQVKSQKKHVTKAGVSVIFGVLIGVLIVYYFF